MEEIIRMLIQVPFKFILLAKNIGLIVVLFSFLDCEAPDKL